MLGHDEPTSGEVVSFVIGSSSNDGADVMLLSLESKRPTKALEEPMPRAHELEEDEDTDNMPLARRSCRYSAQTVLAGMWRVVRMVDLTYVLSGMPSFVDLTTLEVGSKTSKWNCYDG